MSTFLEDTRRIAFRNHLRIIRAATQILHLPFILPSIYHHSSYPQSPWLFIQPSSFFTSLIRQKRITSAIHATRCLCNTSGNNVRVSLSQGRGRKKGWTSPPDMHDRSRVQIGARKIPHRILALPPFVPSLPPSRNI